MQHFLSCTILLVFLPFIRAYSQDITANKVNYPQAAVENATYLYNKLMAKQMLLYNGSEYIDFDRSIKGNQYFESEDWEEGNIFYDGQLYKQVFLRYDLYDDVVITEHFDRRGYYAKVQLIGEKINYFDLLGHHFIHIEPNSAAVTVLRTGFYDLIFDGQVKVMVRRIKEIQQSTSTTNFREEFRQRNRIYLHKDDLYYSVKSKRSVIKVLKDQKKELRRFARRSHLNFKEDRENSIAKLAAHYQQKNPMP